MKRMSVPLSSRSFALVVAVIVACISAWGAIHFVSPLFYLGFPGAMAMIVITGAHGGTKVQEIIGRSLFLIVNAGVYYFLIRFCIQRLLTIYR
ncbi:MAG TPA: hypothetical protein VIY53_01745 [Acidobacteriaceae bacterium]